MLDMESFSDIVDVSNIISCLFKTCNFACHTIQELSHHLEKAHTGKVSKGVQAFFNDPNNKDKITSSRGGAEDLVYIKDQVPVYIKGAYKFFYAIQEILDFLYTFNKEDPSQNIRGGGAFKQCSGPQLPNERMREVNQQFKPHSLSAIENCLKALRLDEGSVFADMSPRLGELVYVVALTHDIPCIAFESFNPRHTHSLKAFEKIRRMFKGDRDISRRLQGISFQIGDFSELEVILHASLKKEATHIFIGDRQPLKINSLRGLVRIFKKSKQIRGLIWKEDEPYMQALDLHNFKQVNANVGAVYYDSLYRELFGYVNTSIPWEQDLSFGLIIDKRALIQYNPTNPTDKLIHQISALCEAFLAFEMNGKGVEGAKRNDDEEEEKKNSFKLKEESPPIGRHSLKRGASPLSGNQSYSGAKRQKIGHGCQVGGQTSIQDYSNYKQNLETHTQRITEKANQMKEQCLNQLCFIEKQSLINEFQKLPLRRLADITMTRDQVQELISDAFPHRDFLKAQRQEQRGCVVAFDYYLRMKQQKEELVLRAYNSSGAKPIINNILIAQNLKIEEYERTILDQTRSALESKHIKTLEVIASFSHAAFVKIQFNDEAVIKRWGLLEEFYAVQIPKFGASTVEYNRYRERQQLQNENSKHVLAPLICLRILNKRFLVFNYYKHSLQSLFNSKRPIPEEIKTSVLIGIARGCLSQQPGFKAHLNLSPECIFLDDSCQVLVFGYGSQNVLCGGKRGYQPPEQFQKWPNLFNEIEEGLEKVDAYAAGVIIYQLFYGRMPYSEGDLNVMEQTGIQPKLPSWIRKPTRYIDRLLSLLLKSNPRQRSSLSQICADMDFHELCLQVQERGTLKKYKGWININFKIQDFDCQDSGVISVK